MSKINKRNNCVVRKSLILLLLCLLPLPCASCAKKEHVEMPVLEDYDIAEEVEEINNIKVGVVSGPYGEMFQKTIQPALEDKGYTVSLMYYENYDEPNFALADGEIDLNMFQHYKYLNDFKFENDLHLSAITKIPTAAMGIYSAQWESYEELVEGAVVAIPNDSTNLSRALLILEAAGLVTIDSFIDKSKATVDNLIENPRNLQFELIHASSLVEALSEYDMAVINGNFAISEGLELSDALYKEVLGDDYINVIAVRTTDLSRKFVEDIIDVVQSEEYKNIITDDKGEYSDFQRPRRFLN